MTLKRLLREARDLLSYTGFGFLLVMGFQQAFPIAGLTRIPEQRWVGFWILLSALAIADRLRAARKAITAGAAERK